MNASSGQGALFELMARGVKDAYFVKDKGSSTFPYDARYDSSVHHLAERRTEVPLAGATFGAPFEIEIAPFGDVMTECALEVDLPSWLPPQWITENGLYPITTPSGTSYGYVNYAAYFLFEKIQFLQDQFVIQEWSGDGLLAKQLTEGSSNSSFLRQVQGGLMDSTGLSYERSIQLRATPGHLRIVLPLPGMQCPGDAGFPLAACPWQTYRIKGILRKLEDMVVCSDPTVFKPSPWNLPELMIHYDNGDTAIIVPRTKLQMEQPTLLLSTVQHYLPPTAQNELRTKPIEIPFRKTFENVFTFGELDYISLDKGGVASCTRRLDGRHPTERMFWFFRNSTALDQNRLDDWHNDYFETHLPTAAQPLSYSEFYYDIKLNIAGKERDELYGPLVWGSINQLVHDERGNGKHIGSINWTTGEKYGVVYPCPRQPEGTINLTTADKPTLLIQLANITNNVYLAQRKAELRVWTEGWNVYVVQEGRGRVQFAS